MKHSIEPNRFHPVALTPIMALSQGMPKTENVKGSKTNPIFSRQIRPTKFSITIDSPSKPLAQKHKSDETNPVGFRLAIRAINYRCVSWRGPGGPIQLALFSYNPSQSRARRPSSSARFS
jgi:hypothetical protein